MVAAGADARVGGTKQVTGVDEIDVDAVGNRDRAVVADRLELRDRAERIRFGVERQRWVVLRVGVTVGVRSILFLNPPRVRQHDAAEILSAWRAEDASAEAVRDEPRKIAAVIEMRVRQHDSGQVRRVEGQAGPVPLAQLLQPLKQPAVNEDLRSTRIEEMLRPRHRSGRTKKSQVQSSLLWMVRQKPDATLREQSNLAAGVPEQDRFVLFESAGANVAAVQPSPSRCTSDRETMLPYARAGQSPRATQGLARRSLRRRSRRRSRRTRRRSGQAIRSSTRVL